MIATVAAALLPIAQNGDGFVRDRSGEAAECVAKNDTVCIGWAIDNFDRYVTPLLEHIVLVSVSVVIGFLIAFALALVSHGGAG